MDNETIIEKAEDLFITKDLFDTRRPLIVASVITAASKMANVSNIISEEVALEELIDAYEAGNNEEIMALLGDLPRTLVEQTIGYTPNYEFAALAKPAYLERKDEYNFLYSTLKVNHKLKEKPDDLKQAM